MARCRFFIVDVFGEEKLQGNQLAVVEAREPLPDALMQALAAEFNFAETTFFDPVPGPGGGFAVRIFTPRKEVPFAGHPTLGTAHVIRNEILGGDVERVDLELRAGPMPVRFLSGGEAGLVSLTAGAPDFGAVHGDLSAAAALVGLASGDLDDRFPVQEISAGIPFLMLPVRTLAAVKRAAVDAAACARYFPGKAPTPLFLFCPETYDPARQINCRMFAPAYGIPEDPATGSANVCLAGYLVAHRYFGTPEVRVLVEQGFEIGRRSVLHLAARERDGALHIEVGGKVFDVAEGRLR